MMRACEKYSSTTFVQYDQRCSQFHFQNFNVNNMILVRDLIVI